jgi:hypothetical protein
MAAGPMTFYDKFAESIGDGTIDLDNDTLKVALFTSSYTPNDDTDVSYSALTNEVANQYGYTTGGYTLTGVTWAETAGVATLDAADASWTASGGSIVARHAVLYSSTAGTNNLIAHFLLDSTPADVTVTDTNTLTIAWNGSGILTLTV